MPDRHIGLAVLSTNHWLTIKVNPELIEIALSHAQVGRYQVVQYPNPPLRRRPFPKPAPLESVRDHIVF
jgi:hypothetical protein